MTPTGFVPADAAWWPAIRANIAKPWPKEAAMMDLRWHADRERMQDRANAMPGRPALIDRWGWTDWGVKQLLKGEEWVDRWTTEDAARTPPAHRQRTASAPPAGARLSADNIDETASAPPADHQAAASQPPRARFLTPITDHRSPITDSQDPAVPATKPSDDPPAAAMNTPKRIDPTLDDPNRIIPRPPVEVLPPRQTSGPPLFAAPVPVKAPAPDPVAETHAVYRQAHKRSTLTDDNRKAVRTLIQRCDGPERAQSYLAWVASSMDERAMQLRGDAPWPDGKPHARDDLYSLAQPHFVAKAMAAVDAWVARGRIDLYVPAAAERPTRTSRSMDVARALYEEGLDHTDHHDLALRRESR